MAAETSVARRKVLESTSLVGTIPITGSERNVVMGSCATVVATVVASVGRWRSTRSTSAVHVGIRLRMRWRRLLLHRRAVDQLLVDAALYRFRRLWSSTLLALHTRRVVVKVTRGTHPVAVRKGLSRWSLACLWSWIGVFSIALEAVQARGEIVKGAVEAVPITRAQLSALGL